MRTRIIGSIVLALCPIFPAPTAWAAIDHANLIEGPLKTGPEVTGKCLGCHKDSAAEVMRTTHWTWSSEQSLPDKGRVDRGKKNAINNFCVSVSGNWPRCTSCHVGYGWKDAGFDFNDPGKVDCLVCHDTTGTYKKDPKGAGMPQGPTTAKGDKPAKPGVDLLYVARNVGKPSRANCGTCHFFGGGGDKVKHGDLDTSMFEPTRSHDVHMAVDGQNFACQDCHQTKGHRIKGNAMVVSPGGDSRVVCSDCHGAAPHDETRINMHTTRVACQTCHVPTFAKTMPTKTSWDWSQAGQDREVEQDALGMATYAKKKGSFTWGKNIVPTYAWYNGQANAYLLGDMIDPSVVTRLNWPEGHRNDPTAKIYPFKIHKGRQIYDAENRYLVTPKLFGKDGYWKTYDWNKAAELGMKASGLPYSGEYGWADTIMYWRINHMVVPAKDALQCLDCHGDRGRLDWAELGYPGDPMKAVARW